jgi:hypothetical protein
MRFLLFTFKRLGKSDHRGVMMSIQSAGGFIESCDGIEERNYGDGTG